jgi:hypothetical protein
MRNLFLPIVIAVLLVTSGFGQTPAPSASADPASVKGCLSGSDGNYTLAEDGTTQTFKVTSSAVDLKPHLGHDIAVTGAKTMATSSGVSDNSVAVTAVSMISDHCATASTSTAAASTPAVAETIPSTTTSTPAIVEPTPAATASAPVITEPAPVAAATPPVVVDPAPAAAPPAPAASTRAPDDAKQIPNTATSLPMLGLLGVGLLGLGWLNTRSRTN